MTATRTIEYSVFAPVLYLAFELSNTHWRLGFTTGPGQRPRQRTIKARDLEGLQDEIRRAKKRFDLADDAQVVSCYEAGRDGFSRKDIGTMWFHRYLVEHAIKSLVVDSSSIQVNRRARQAKTDRMDVEKLVSQLIRFRSGEQGVWSVVRVPSVETEDKRQLHRELLTLKKERTRHINRIKSFLVGQGIQMMVKANFLEEIDRVRKWDDTALPNSLKARIQREYARLQLVQEQIKRLPRKVRGIFESGACRGDSTLKRRVRRNCAQSLTTEWHRAKRELAFRDGVFQLAQIQQSQGHWIAIERTKHLVPGLRRPARIEGGSRQTMPDAEGSCQW